MIMGTVAYMSPEQARGKPADHRSDQFSFGLILYEMAAVHKAFDKPEAVQVMSAILSEEPEPIKRNIPAPLRWVIDRCLAKEPVDRYESTRDLFQDLRHIRDHLAETTMFAGNRRRIGGASRGDESAGSGSLSESRASRRFSAQVSIYRRRSCRINRAIASRRSRSIRSASRCPSGRPTAKAVAYAGYVATSKPNQVFVRYLDSPAPIQITSGPDSVEPIAWAPDSKPRRLPQLASASGTLVGFCSRGRAGEFHGDQRNWVPGGLTGPADCGRHAAGRGRRECGLGQFAARRRAAEVPAQPDGDARRSTTPPICASRRTARAFSYSCGATRGRTEAWLMPYPANASKPPHVVQSDLTPYGGTPQFSWMPDSPPRRAVLRVFTRVIVATLDGRHRIRSTDRSHQRHREPRFRGCRAGWTSNRLHRIRGRLRPGGRGSATRHCEPVHRDAARRIHGCLGPPNNRPWYTSPIGMARTKSGCARPERTAP